MWVAGLQKTASVVTPLEHTGVTLTSPGLSRLGTRVLIQAHILLDRRPKGSSATGPQNLLQDTVNKTVGE